MERELIDLNELKKWKHKRIQSGECSYDDMVALGRFIEDVPRVDAVRGEWKDRSDGGRILYPWMESHECSQCESWGSSAWNYCPYCGSRNRKE